MRIYLLLFIAILNFFIPTFITPLFDLDEGAFSEATREMLINHNYITTYLNGDLRFDKPILIYWFQLFSIKIFGLNEFAVRFPSALAGTIWLFSIYYFSKRYLGEKIALLASLFMSMSLQINMIVKASIADSLLNMFITLTMFFVWFYIDTKKKKYLYYSYLFIALGVLTKGPVAILIPVSVVTIYFLIKKDLKTLFKILFDYKGILIFLIVALPWYILEYIDQGEKFIQGFFIKHNIKRFDTSLEGHTGSLLYFVPVLLIGLLPFSNLIFSMFKKIKNIFNNNFLLFLFIWFSFVFIFFSLSGTKLPHYIIYGYTPLFILMAYSYKRFNIFSIIPTIIFIVLMTLLPVVVKYKLENIDDLFVEATLENFSIYFNTIYQVSLILLIIVIFIIYKSKISDIYKNIFIGIIFSLLFNYIVTYKYAQLTQVPIKEAALYAKDKNLDVIMIGKMVPGFCFYREKVYKKVQPKSGNIVFLRVNKLKNFQDYDILYQKNGYYLIKVKK